MGMIENVIGSLLGGGNNQQGAQASGMGGVLSDILGGGSNTAGTNQGGNSQGGNSQGGTNQGGMLGGSSGGAGGIGGLVSMFEGAGLGHIVQSWIGGGQNSSVSPDQLNSVFGDKVPGMAQKAGMNQGDFLSQLSQHLPGAVDQSTPGGQADNGSVNV